MCPKAGQFGQTWDRTRPMAKTSRSRSNALPKLAKLGQTPPARACRTPGNPALRSCSSNCSAIWQLVPCGLCGKVQFGRSVSDTCSGHPPRPRRVFDIFVVPGLGKIRPPREFMTIFGRLRPKEVVNSNSTACPPKWTKLGPTSARVRLEPCEFDQRRADFDQVSADVGQRWAESTTFGRVRRVWPNLVEFDQMRAMFG